MRVFSFGGGVQSHGVLALTQQGRLHYDAFLFCNVGDKAESPKTLAYIKEVTIPWCELNGIAFHVLQRRRMTSHKRLGLVKGDTEDLYEVITRTNTRSIQIPVRMANGAPGNRHCTDMFKIEVIRRWCLDHGATDTSPFAVGIGISLDEIGRARTDQPDPTQRREYPLIESRVTREMCRQINEAAGFHDVPRSACWFCPMKKIGEWEDQARNEPELFARSVDLEARLNHKREALGKDHIFMNSRRVSLPMLGSSVAVASEFEEQCDSGHCMT